MYSISMYMFNMFERTTEINRPVAVCSSMHFCELESRQSLSHFVDLLPSQSMSDRRKVRQ